MEESDRRADNDEELTILVEGQSYKVRRNVICEHSDYFRAMLSGNFMETSTTEPMTIELEVKHADIVGLVFQYMDNTLNLAEHSRSDIAKLACLSNYLQITGLSKQIDDLFYHQLAPSNWLETIDIADQIPNNKLKQYAVTYGLLSFDRMLPEYIPSVNKLYWYLSHSYLHAKRELDIFIFGLQWIRDNPSEGIDLLKVLLCCLDLKRLTFSDWSEIKKLTTDFNEPGKKLVDCLLELSVRGEDRALSTVLLEKKDDWCVLYSENFYNDLVSFIESSTVRQPSVIPLTHIREPHLQGYKVVKAETQYPTYPGMKGYQLILKGLWCVNESSSPMLNKSFEDYFPEGVEQNRERRPNMYAYTGSKPAPWVEIPFHDLAGWSIVAWRLTKLVVVCGTYTVSGQLTFMRDVLVYDTITKLWTSHGVELPHMRHAGVAILENSLHIAGLRWENESISSMAIIYDLEQRTYRSIAPLPIFITAITSSPLLVAHEGHIYGIADHVFYKFTDDGEHGDWNPVPSPFYFYECRTHFVESYGGYIYYVENNAPYPHKRNIKRSICRFKPGSSEKTYIPFRFPPIDLCSTGDRLIAFTEEEKFPKPPISNRGEPLPLEMNASHDIAVEEHTSCNNRFANRLLWHEENLIDKNIPHGYFYNNGRCCAIGSIDFESGLVPMYPCIPEYHEKCLAGHQREPQPMATGSNDLS